VTCIVAEGQYASAVDTYNGSIVARGGAQDVEAPPGPAGSKDPDPYDDEGRLKKSKKDANAPP
jgi:hypothetical protein